MNMLFYDPKAMRIIGKQNPSFNEREKEFYYNAYWCYMMYTGGLECTMCDYPEDSTEYKTAENTLNNKEGLKEYVFVESVRGEYGPGTEGYNEKVTKHFNFIGNDRRKEIVNILFENLKHGKHLPEF